MTELENSVENFSNRFAYEEERISKLKDRSFGISQLEEQKEKRKKSEENLCELWDALK